MRSSSSTSRRSTTSHRTPGRWARRCPPRAARWPAATTPANGKIYLNGGYETAFIDSVSGQTWEFDPAAGTFTEKAPSPQIQGGTASGVINGHLIMAGGRTNPDATLDLAWDYNIASDSWTQLTSMPVAENVAG